MRNVNDLEVNIAECSWDWSSELVFVEKSCMEASAGVLPWMKEAGMRPVSWFPLKSTYVSLMPKQPGTCPVILLLDRSIRTSSGDLQMDFGMVPVSLGFPEMTKVVRVVSLAMDRGMVPVRLELACICSHLRAERWPMAGEMGPAMSEYLKMKRPLTLPAWRSHETMYQEQQSMEEFHEDQLGGLPKERLISRSTAMSFLWQCWIDTVCVEDNRSSSSCRMKVKESESMDMVVSCVLRIEIKIDSCFKLQRAWFLPILKRFGDRSNSNVESIKGLDNTFIPMFDRLAAPSQDPYLVRSE